MTTAVIIGAGDLGGAVARHLAASGTMTSITLMDEAGSVAHGKALDIRQAGPIDRYSTALSGANTLDCVISATFIVIADRAASPGEEWQDDAGAALVGRVAELNPTAPIVCAGARQAGLVQRAVRERGLARTRIFGSAPEGLRSAVIALTALEAGGAAPDISLTVLGLPPDHIIVPWEDASIAGRRATSVLTPPAIARLEQRLARMWPPGPLTLACAAASAITAAAKRTPRTCAAFVSVTRAEGALGRVGILPVTLTPGGIGEVVTPVLTRRDQVRLESVFSA